MHLTTHSAGASPLLNQILGPSPNQNASQHPSLSPRQTGARDTMPSPSTQRAGRTAPLGFLQTRVQHAAAAQAAATAHLLAHEPSAAAGNAHEPLSESNSLPEGSVDAVYACAKRGVALAVDVLERAGGEHAALAPGFGILQLAIDDAIEACS